MTNMRNIILLLVLLMVGEAKAQHDISVEDALHKASAFFKQKCSMNKARALVNDNDFELAYTASLDGVTSFYAFNRPDNGGYILISADDRSQDVVLAYSHEGHFDYDALSENARYMVDAYTKGIADIKRTGKAPARSKALAPKQYVEPLLGDIEWNQGSPYNDLCPVVDGYRCPTGCVATAMAQIMRYHRWPERGRGSHSYEWKGQTLSANFNHEYKWDLMLPRYKQNYTKEQAAAVAELMRDCGYSIEMSYAPGGSGAAAYRDALVEYFDYDKSIAYMCLDDTSLDHYKEIIYNELAEGRPVGASGGSSIGGHEFIFDGYDSDGLVHVNYGWGGADNGYYSVTNTGFDSSPSITYGIQKNYGGKPRVYVDVDSEFLWDDDSQMISCVIFFRNIIPCEEKVRAALAYENTETHEVVYVEHNYSEHGNWINNITVNVPNGLADGDYYLYPAYSENGSGWQQIYYPDRWQGVVTMHKRGEDVSFTNDFIKDGPDPGHIEIDGIYYLLDKGIAEVTYKNQKYNSYSGDITIPRTVKYDGKEYEVKSIGSRAFYECKLGKLTIPSTLQTMTGFYSCRMDEIIFEPGYYNLSIGGFCFQYTSFGNKLTLPDGTTSIYSCAFECTRVMELDLPESVRYMGSESFRYNPLTNVTVHWNEPKDIFPKDVFHVLKNPCTLYVPRGTKAKYAAIPTWQVFDSIEEYDATDIEKVKTADVPSASRKHLVGNRIVIDRNGKQYNIVGQEIQ